MVLKSETEKTMQNKMLKYMHKSALNIIRTIFTWQNCVSLNSFLANTINTPLVIIKQVVAIIINTFYQPYLVRVSTGFCDHKF